MVEVLDNAIMPGTSTLLAEPLASTDLVMQVQGSASPALQGGEFRSIIIDPQTGLSELVMVTGGQNTAQWQIERGLENTTPRDFPQNSLVKHILTVGSLKGIVSYSVGTGDPDQVITVRSDGTIAWNTPQAISARAWGCDPSKTSAQNSTAIANALIQAGLNLGKGAGNPYSGSKVELPSGDININESILMTFSTRLHGVNGQSSTKLIADPNGNYNNGGRNASATVMLKWDGGDMWAHGVQVTDIEFDTNGIPGLGAVYFEEAGEKFWLDKLTCSSTVAVQRTINDAQLTAGSNLVTMTASTVTDQDVNAILDFSGGIAAPAAPILTPSPNPPSAPTYVESDVGGTLAAGLWYVVITYVTATGESVASNNVTIVTAGGASQITVNSPAAATGVTGWRAYISNLNGSGSLYYLHGGTNAIGANVTITAAPAGTEAHPPAASTLVAGTYTVGLTYLTANGETALSGVTNLTISAGQSVTISSPPALTGATGWFAYVSQPGGGYVVWRQQAPGAATAIGTNLTISAPPVQNTANPYKKIDRINWGSNDQGATKTSFYMNYPAAATIANATVVIHRPTDAFTVHGGAAGKIGILNGVQNSGALLRFIGAIGTWNVDQLSGDDNPGGMVRCSLCASSGDPCNIVIQQMKVESDPQYTPMSICGYAHDPVILLDRCFTMGLKVVGGSFSAGTMYSRDMVRLDNSFSQPGSAPSPSIELNIEGQNWYNPQWTNIIHDTLSGEVIPVTKYGDHAYPTVIWGRPVLLGGGSDIPAITIPGASGFVKPADMLPWTHFFSLGAQATPLVYGAGTWTNYATNGSFWTGLLGYEGTGAQNAGVGWYVTLAKGTWVMQFWGNAASSRGIATFDISFDGGNTWTNIGTQDQYTAGASGPVMNVFQGIVVPNNCKAILRAQQLSKNAASTGYGITYYAMSWLRTA